MNKYSRLFLGISALAWLPYGLFCFSMPGFLEKAAGVMSTTPTGLTEIRAMYGGLQMGIGALALAALFREALVRPTIFMLAFLYGGLAGTRVLGLLMDGGPSGYTIFALSFELPATIIAIWLLLKDAGEDAAPHHT